DQANSNRRPPVGPQQIKYRATNHPNGRDADACQRCQIFKQRLVQIRVLRYLDKSPQADLETRESVTVRDTPILSPAKPQRSAFKYDGQRQNAETQPRRGEGLRMGEF